MLVISFSHRIARNHVERACRPSLAYVFYPDPYNEYSPYPDTQGKGDLVQSHIAYTYAGASVSGTVGTSGYCLRITSGSFSS